uniref:G protein-coupled receptor 31 n=1 Tax=Ictidomys tridecemlineatus TaxID=43179 RepID=A0A287CWU7_ICTTR
MVRPSCSAPSTSVETAVGVLLALECGLGLPGHAAALWTFFRLEVWKPYTVYLLSLVLADLLLTACLPFHAAFHLRHRAWGPSLTSCQALLCLLLLSRGVGVAFLTNVACHRNLRALHPRMAWGISGLVWLLLAALTHQSLLVSKAPQNSTKWPSFYPSTTGQEVLFFLQILLPFGLISFCNASIIRTLQRRIRVSHQQPRLLRAKVLVTAVLLLLGLCFLPSVLTRVLMHTLQGSQSCSVLQSRCTWPRCTHLHSVLNPADYFSNPAFTHSYQKVFSSLRGRRQAAEPPSSDLKDSY